ncbi:MAG: phosphoadenylyl-sulfate reductase [Gemmataceae bacterium]
MNADAIAELDDRTTGLAPEAVLRIAAEAFPAQLLMATAFGAEGCCLLHMLAAIAPTTTIINLDTGYQFPETLALRDRFLREYGLFVEMIQPELPVAQYETEHGGPLYPHRPDQCCHDRKILPLRQALARHAPKAWISAIRGDQTPDRAAARVVQWDAKFQLVKINPLLGWTKKDVWKYLLQQNVPYNPLHDQGYPSIGCAPCTRPVGEGEDERAGRWAGRVKKECGLHVIEHSQGSGI